MGRILYVGGELDTIETISGLPTVTTLSSQYDSSYADCALVVSSNSTLDLPFYDESGIVTASPNDGRVLYFHCSLNKGSGGTGVGPFTIIDENDRPFIRANIASDVLQIQHNTSSTATPTWVTAASTFIPFGMVAEWDLALKTGASKELKLFLDGNQMASAPFTNTLSAALKKIRLTATSLTFGMSQIIVTEDISTVGAKVRTRKPSAAGSVSEWTGGYANLVKTSLNDTTAIISTLAGQISTFAYQDNTTAAGLQISSVWLWSRAKNDGSAPTNLKAVCRIGGVNYKSGNLTGVGGGYTAAPARWDANPSNSAKWLDSAFNAAEFGVESAA